MTVFNSFVDSLAGFLGGLQGDREQLAQQQGALAATTAMDPAALELSYRTDWVARKGIDIPAKDATRQWRSWQAEQDAIEKLEETERLFKIRSRVRTAMTRARLYGGCIIVPGLKSQTDLTKPLDLTKVGKGDLVYCHVISQQSATAGIPIEDIESEWYGQPSYYQLRSRDGSQDIRIHPSRTIKMVGAEMPDERAAQLTAHQGWGDSALLTVAAAVRDTNLITDAIAAMAQDARIDVFRIPNLTANITTKGYKDRLTERLQFAQNAKSIVNSLVMDKEEEWDRRETSFSALPDLIKIYLMICAGGFDIPVTRFLGDSPSGLNATGVSDLRNYYDNVKAGQELELSPVLSPLDELLIRTTFGTRDPAIYYEWNPLWQEDAAAKAARAVQYASVFKTDVDAALFNPDVLREARLNQLIELGIYPGIEGLTEEYDLADVPEPAAPLPGQPGGPPAANANDPAAPKPAAAAPPRKAGVADRRAAIRARVRDHQRRMADYNENHDPGSGEFASGEGGGGGGGGKRGGGGGGATGPGLATLKARPSPDAPADVADASFSYSKLGGNTTMPVEKLTGGVRMSDPKETERVRALANQMQAEDGHFARIVVEKNGDVLEGQHRLEAARMLGYNRVPVSVVVNLENYGDVTAMDSALKTMGGIAADQRHQMIQHALEAIHDTGSAEKALAETEIGGTWQRYYEAALKAAGTPRVKDRRKVGDARPRTLYVRRDVVNADEILRWAKAQGFETTVPAAELHVTVTFSRDAVDWMTMGEAYSYGPTDGDRSKGQITISQGGPRMVDQLGPENGIVLLFASTELSYRHQSMRSGGASFDFPEYQPHITITYAGTPEQVQKARAGQIEPYRGKIVLGPEIFEEVNPDWKQSIQEEG